MTEDDVLAVCDALDAGGIPHWLDGGWGVDALLGAQHRPHGDVDLVAELARTDDLVAALGPLGYHVAEDLRPTRLVLRAAVGPVRQVDVHPITFDADGTGRQAGADPVGGDCAYPADGFTTGTVGHRTVGCLTAELQLAHHTGYEHDDVDRHDVALLEQLR